MTLSIRGLEGNQIWVTDAHGVMFSFDLSDCIFYLLH